MLEDLTLEIFNFLNMLHYFVFYSRTILSKQGECNVSFDMSTLNIIIVKGVVMVAMNVIAAFLITFIGKKSVISWF